MRVYSSHCGKESCLDVNKLQVDLLEWLEGGDLKTPKDDADVPGRNN
jgi:hypothetical protein